MSDYNWDRIKNDQRPIDEVIVAALALEGDEYWEEVMILHQRGTREVFDAAIGLCKSEDPVKREVGSDILGQLGGGPPPREFDDESAPYLIEMLRNEQDPNVISSACIALGHIDDPRAIEVISGFKKHPDNDIRFRVARALGFKADPIAINTLIELTKDKDDEVRNWATFGLGNAHDDDAEPVDSEEIREALAKRLDDDFEEARWEAIAGLARRKDLRAIDEIIKEGLECTFSYPMLFESMDEFPHTSLLPMLKKLQENWVENLQELNKIIEKCTDNLPGHNEMPGKALSRFTFYSDLFRGHIIDLTAPLNKKTICYPGDPQFKRSWFRKYKDSGVNLSFVETGLHVGTHVDAPLHFLDKGQSIDSMPAGVFSGEAWVIKALKKPFQDITPEDVEKNEINPGEIIFFYTGWSKRVNTPRFFEEGWPGITPEAMDLLIAKGVKAIGIDSGSVDSAAGLAAGCLAHKKAAEAGIPIFETLVNLDKFNGRFYFFGFPLRFEGAEASPVRAIGVTPYDL